VGTPCAARSAAAAPLGQVKAAWLNMAGFFVNGAGWLIGVVVGGWVVLLLTTWLKSPAVDSSK
jgi:hypothetical protein